MISNLFSRIGDAAHDIIDLYFAQTHLKDINITEAERCQTAHLDAMASGLNRMSSHSGDINPYTGDDTPIGKTVL